MRAAEVDRRSHRRKPCRRSASPSSISSSGPPAVGSGTNMIANGSSTCAATGSPVTTQLCSSDGDEPALRRERRRRSLESVDMRFEPVERRQTEALGDRARAPPRRRRGRAARRRGSGRAAAGGRSGRSCDPPLFELGERALARAVAANARKRRGAVTAARSARPRPCRGCRASPRSTPSRLLRPRATARFAAPACRRACARSCPASDRRGRARDARFP